VPKLLNTNVRPNPYNINNPLKKREKQMARGKAISVKIPTQRVIDALEKSLAKLELDYTSQEEKDAKFQIAYKAWQKELAEYAIANWSKAENVRTNFRSYSKTLNLDFDIIGSEKNFPTEPVKDFDTIHQHSYNEQKEEISNAIRILKMTDEETVNTSTYNAVARYL
jgi:hypothetical protein